MSGSQDEGNADGIEVQVFRSARKADTYLFLPVGDSYDDLPDALREHFGDATAFLSFWLHEERFLAQADPLQVLSSIREQGFYLQLPPRDEPAENG